tara:strand:- start:160 stop:540 length:381 start_codon:yes stop_codon:yes gene_type:complete
MAAGIYNFTIEQGTTVVKQFTYKDAAGTVVDLGSHDVRMQIRETVTSEIPVSTFGTGSAPDPDGITVVLSSGSAKSGTIELRIEASETKDYNFTQAVYDIEIEDPTSHTVTRLLQGSIRLSPEITR